MNTKRSIIPLLLLLIACKTNSNSGGVSISVLEDRTESDFLERPDTTTILSRYSFNEDLYRAARFRYSPLSSLNHTSKKELSLPGEHPFLANELMRREKIKTFNQKVSTLLEQNKDNSSHSHSSLWKPIVQEILYLQTHPMEKQILLIYSDLEENNPYWFSVHDPDEFKLLQTKPEAIKKCYLQKAEGIKRNDPLIKVIVIYRPKDMPSDARFSLLVSLYQSVFEELGISIAFITQLNSNE